MISIFFVGLKKQQLEINALGNLFESGSVKLSDLLFRRELLDSFPSPLRLVAGYVGRIEIAGLDNILTGGTTVVRVENVHIVLTPTDDAYGATDTERWQTLLALVSRFLNPYNTDFLTSFVRDVLQQLPATGKAKKSAKQGKPGASDDKKTAGGVSGEAAKWVPKLIERAEVQLKNVHIRLEVNGGGGEGGHVRRRWQP